jgi:RND family efflux transporter MFP subunit
MNCFRFATALVIGFGVAGCSGGPAVEDHAVPPRASVEAATVARGPVAETVETYGTAEFAPYGEHSMTLVRSGQVVDVPVVAGEIVHKGDELLTVGPMPTGSLAVQQARIDADYAARELARVRRLVDEKLATNSELQNAEKQLAAAQAALRAVGDGGGGGQIQIRAQTDGVVATVLVHPGEVVQAGQQAVVLAGEGSIAVRAGFEVEDLARLSEGLHVWLEPVYQGPAGARVEAELSRLHRVVDPSTQLVEGLIEVPKPPSWLAAGLAVRGTVVLRSKPDALRIPREAMLELDGKTGVYELRDGHAHWQPVSVGIAGDSWVEVTQGVAAGDTIATIGRSSLSDGIAVTIDPAQGDG